MPQKPYANGRPRDEEVTALTSDALEPAELAARCSALEERLEQQALELERRHRVAEGLHEILAILNSCCPEDQVLDAIVEQGRQLLGCDAVSIYRLEVDAGHLRMQVASGLAEESVADLVIPVGEYGIVTTTILERRPMVVPDVTALAENAYRYMTDPGQQELLTLVFARYRAVLAVPIVISEQLYGALVAYYPRPREFSEEDVALALDLADHLALALENAGLREQAEESAVSAERNRLARDLHDAVTQTLFSASMIAEVLPTLWERDPAEGIRRLAQLRELTRGALAEMRSLLLELRPAALEDAELCDLLRQLAEAGTTRSGIPIAAEAEACGALGTEEKIALYRIAQEALNNLIKHSGATRAAVSLTKSDERLVLEVTDDGHGFDPVAGPSERLGLGIMRERAAAIGARLDIESGPDGTTVTALWKPSEEGCCS